MKKLAFLLLGCCVILTYAQEYTIKGSIYDPSDPHLTLIDLSNNSIIWSGDAEKRPDNPRISTGLFSFSAPKGRYVLCIHNSFYSRAYYQQIDLVSDMDLGEVRQEDTEFGTIRDGYDQEKQGGVHRIVILNPSTNRFDLFTLLKNLGFADFRFYAKDPPGRIMDIEIDGVPVQGNFWEQIQYLKKKSTKKVKYIETHSPSESYPCGLIRLLTTRYLRTVENNPSAGRFNILGTIKQTPSANPVLVKLSDNSIVWRGQISKGRQFSINIEQGDYVFCVPFSSLSRYIPVHGTTNVDLGVVGWDTIKYPRSNMERLFHSSGQRYFPSEVVKEYDVLLVLNVIGLLVGSIPPNAPFMSAVQINGEPVIGNLLEVVKKLRNTPATNVEYVDVTYPTEEYPGGLLNIITSAGIEKE